ncbi:MAG: hypothetical protein ACIAQZ_09435 [Sedimentisphaeraceae bacterium JB056]
MLKRMVVLMVLIAACSMFAAVYDIPHNSISDHGDATVQGSIAWYFSTYSINDTYRLSSSANYYTSKTLTVPSNSILTVTSGASAVIKAGGNSSSPVYDSPLIILQNGAQIYGRDDDYSTLKIDANKKARNGIDTRYATGNVIMDCTVINTLNTYSTSGMKYQHLINGDGTTELLVDHCLLRYAGYPALNINSYDSVARGISVCNSTDPEIIYCDIAYTMGSTVAIAETVGAEIGHNYMQYSGLCSSEYGESYSEDSIIGYHNTGATSGVDKRCYIRYNLIRYYGNHGVHVSGKGFHIDYNEIYGGEHCAVYLGDWRSPDTECSSDSTISNNYVKWGSSYSPNYPIYINPYKNGTISVYGNTGDTTVQWGSTCN